MRSRQVLALGQKGPKKFLKRYGEQLICAHYPYDEQQLNAAALSKSLSNESGWSLPGKLEIVGLRVEFQETELQRRGKQAGGKWNSTKRV